MQITLNRSLLMWLAVVGLIAAGAVLLIRGLSSDDAGSATKAPTQRAPTFGYINPGQAKQVALGTPPQQVRAKLGRPYRTVKRKRQDCWIYGIKGHAGQSEMCFERNRLAVVATQYR